MTTTKTNKQSDYIFIDHSKDVEKEIAIALGKVCHHIHPLIVNKIAQANIEFEQEFKQYCGKLKSETFFYDKSDCIFPGVRRCISKEKTDKWKRNIYSEDNTILDDNTFPRHIWAFLSKNKPYEGNMWKNSGLNNFELAHIFGHKTDEKELEKKVFTTFNDEIPPYALFTSASNVILVPNGLMKPTDKFEAVKIAFYKRHIDLYGENFCIHNGFKEEFIPEWYSKIKWIKPDLPKDWEIRIDNLLEYRKKYLKNKYAV
jgi:hypothetical protein